MVPIGSLLNHTSTSFSQIPPPAFTMLSTVLERIAECNARFLIDTFREYNIIPNVSSVWNYTSPIFYRDVYDILSIVEERKAKCPRQVWMDVLRQYNMKKEEFIEHYSNANELSEEEALDRSAIKEKFTAIQPSKENFYSDESVETSSEEKVNEIMQAECFCLSRRTAMAVLLLSSAFFMFGIVAWIVAIYRMARVPTRNRAI